MARAKVISQLVAGSQPSLSVTGRADGGGYTVTAGARSLSITAEAGATLLTTVTDQDNASITVTDSTSTTPSWTAPGGGTTGADYCVQVTATKGGLTEQVSFSELVDGSGGGGSGKSWSNISNVDYTASSTGALSSGSAVIGGVTHDVTIPASCTATDDANGIRVSKTGGGFCYLGVDIAALAADIEKPYRVAWALDDITIASGGNVGAAVYSAATPDAAVRAPSVQDRINNAAGTYTDQPLHTTGAVGAGSGFTNPGSGSLVGAVSSCVIEVYVWGSMAAVKLTTGTTTIPAATDPVDVFTDAAYRIMSLATGGAASGSNPSFWPQAWGSVVIGSGSAVAVDADIVELSIDEWG